MDGEWSLSPVSFLYGFNRKFAQCRYSRRRVNSTAIEKNHHPARHGLHIACHGAQYTAAKNRKGPK